ncbi:hypothetical protein O6H91_22G002600 [Diphasiastrum complanatum]|uniref:Uncharacterized protein n=1 Tax=Diphasiastrum complanatum TaxID=34168 RepID=A0ACC2AC65_DIPCM|nr:hypothetical protein O6H91_22G002600 [Diphasiastrum complanatum]
MCRRGVPVGEEVAFGKVISCPTCTKALAVVQPQHGTQLVPCSRCRYNYELMSGDVVSFRSESTSNDWSMIQKWLRWLRLVDRPLPAAVHSFVVQDPNGIARTLRFATETVDVPAQEGERVTFASAAPATAERGIGPFRMSMRTPGWRPSEPMAITNHVTGRITSLLRAPPKSGSGAAFDNAFIVPAALAFASGDVATTFIDPTLPHLIAAYAVATVALGGAVNLFIYPRLNQLPQRTVDAIALRQELLVQYESLQQRVQDLAQVASSEVRMMARMFQLQNKMEAVGEPTYGARIVRVVKAREGIYQQLLTRLKLIDKYAKVASMIEIEVEMDVDVLAAEAVGAVEEQVAHLIEAEDLQKKWRTQAEASDEVERLLNTAPLSNSS